MLDLFEVVDVDMSWKVSVLVAAAWLLAAAIPVPPSSATAVAATAAEVMILRIPGSPFMVTRTCYGRVTGPLALMTWWKATGALVCEHLPALLRAPMARMLSWYFPPPVIPA